MNNTSTSNPRTLNPALAAAEAGHRRSILATMARKSFCVIATTSPAGKAHSAGVIYAYHDGSLWLHVMASSHKASNVAANSSVGICIPFRRWPLGPPYTIHFQATANLVAMDSEQATAILANGGLKPISGHGALDEPDGCFIRLDPRGSVHSYGPGARLVDLVRDPLHHGASSFPLLDQTTTGVDAVRT